MRNSFYSALCSCFQLLYSAVLNISNATFAVYFALLIPIASISTAPFTTAPSSSDPFYKWPFSTALSCRSFSCCLSSYFLPPTAHALLSFPYHSLLYCSASTAPLSTAPLYTASSSATSLLIACLYTTSISLASPFTASPFTAPLFIPLPSNAPLSLFLLHRSIWPLFLPLPSSPLISQPLLTPSSTLGFSLPFPAFSLSCLPILATVLNLARKDRLLLLSDSLV